MDVDLTSINPLDTESVRDCVARCRNVVQIAISHLGGNSDINLWRFIRAIASEDFSCLIDDSDKLHLANEIAIRIAGAIRQPDGNFPDDFVEMIETAEAWVSVQVFRNAAIKKSSGLIASLAAKLHGPDINDIGSVRRLLSMVRCCTDIARNNGDSLLFLIDTNSVGVIFEILLNFPKEVEFVTSIDFILGQLETWDPGALRQRFKKGLENRSRLDHAMGCIEKRSPARSVLERFHGVVDTLRPNVNKLQRMCHACNRTDGEGVKFNCCSQCRITFYCSRECQKSDWKAHKPLCSPPAQQATTSNVSGVDKRAQKLQAESLVQTMRSTETLVHAFIQNNYVDVMEHMRRVRAQRHVDILDIVLWVDLHSQTFGAVALADIVAGRNLPRVWFYPDMYGGTEWYQANLRRTCENLRAKRAIIEPGSILVCGLSASQDDYVIARDTLFTPDRAEAMFTNALLDSPAAQLALLQRHWDQNGALRK